MTPVVRRYVSDHEAALFERIKRSVDLMPDLDLGLDEKQRPIVLSCHMLARATASVFALQYADGYFLPHFEHSWVFTPSGHVIDVYPIAMLGGPVLIDGAIAKKWYRKEHPKKLWGRKLSFRQASFRRCVRKLTKSIKQISASLP